MKKFLALLLCGIGLHAGAQTIQDANAEARTVESFHAIVVSHAFNVYLYQGTADGLAVSAATAADRSNIITEVRNGTLYISVKGGIKWLRGDRKLRAYVSFRQLDRIEAGGACNVFINQTLKAPALQVHLSGASDLKGRVETGDLQVHLSGASDMEISGTVRQLNVDASGASDFKGYGLQTDYCRAEASGASDIRITVRQELSAQASGASNIRYRGEAVLKSVENSGASQVSRGR